MFLSNQKPLIHGTQTISVRNITVKKVVKILGVHFTYDESLWKKLNFDEILKSIKEKLNFWKWRNLTILGRIQIVKTFVIPTLMFSWFSMCSQRHY